MQKYYAAHNCANNEVAMFNSEEERNNWVNHGDWFSETVAKDDGIFLSEERIALSQSEAYELVGDRLYNSEEYIQDNMLDNVMWAVAASGGDCNA